MRSEEGGGGAGGVDVKEVPRPEMKCHQYLSSMDKCGHILNAPFLSISVMMSRRLLTMDFFVHVQYTSTSPPVVAPCSEKFGGKMVVRVACHFTNERSIFYFLIVGLPPRRRKKL